MPLDAVIAAAVPLPAAPDRSFTGDVGPACIGGMIVYTFSHSEKTAFLEAGAKIILEEPDAHEVISKHHRLVEATMMKLSGTTVWPANMRVVLASANNGRPSGEKIQSEFKTVLAKKLKDKRWALRSKIPSPTRTWSM
jgi:hypothetical protein